MRSLNLASILHQQNLYPYSHTHVYLSIYLLFILLKYERRILEYFEFES